MEQHWPADAVERRPLASLLPYAKNARTHSEAQIAQIAASIREFGFVMPILVDEAGTIVAGHGRVLGAARLGLGEVPVMVARGWTQAQVQAYRIADNQIALTSGWDAALLKIELDDLTGSGFDLSLLGFSAADLRQLVTGRPGSPIRTRCLSRRPSRCRGLVIFGCSVRTGCSAVTQPMRTTWPRCSATRTRT